MSEVAMRYLLGRYNWRRTGESWCRLPGLVPRDVFSSLEEASARLSVCEAQTRELVANPFRCGPAFPYLTSFPEWMLQDWLRDVDLEPPELGTPLSGWVNWWDEASPTFTPAQISRTWAGLDKVQFHNVRAEPETPRAFVLLATNWWIEDWRTVAWLPGGMMVEAFFEAEYAERERAARETEARESTLNGEDYYAVGHDDVSRRMAMSDPFGPTPPPTGRMVESDEARYAEIAEVPVLADRPAFHQASRLFLVVEKAFAWIPGTGFWITHYWYTDTSRLTGTPVAAFLTDREAAEDAWRREVEAQ